MTSMNGRAKLTFSSSCMILLSLQYFSESQCIRAIRNPGNVNIAPTMPQDTAMQNLTMIFDAGPLCQKRVNDRKLSLRFNVRFSKEKYRSKLTTKWHPVLQGSSMHSDWNWCTPAPIQFPMYSRRRLKLSSISASTSIRWQCMSIVHLSILRSGNTEWSTTSTIYWKSKEGKKKH